MLEKINNICFFSDCIEILIKASKQENDNLVARKALKYLILENDVFDDNLGIFGLADDIYVVEDTAAKLGGRTLVKAFCLIYL